MWRFWDSFVGPVLTALRPGVLVEIGSSYGDNTRRLLDFCREHDAVLHAVDPLPKFDGEAWSRAFGGHLVLHRARSLDAIPGIGPADAYLIDGDHNWYTVFHELRLIDAVASRRQSGFPLVLLHDVGWPYGRRDLYYNPDDVPDEYRQPFRRGGLLPDSETLRPGGLNADLLNAVSEHGPRNGVLTAVEDFVADRPEPLDLITLHGFHGLGVLASPALTARRPELAGLLRQAADCHRTLAGHLQALEQDRIRHLIRVERLNRKQGRRGGRETAAAGGDGGR